jgi:uncharacterized protein (DUF58 family)
MPAPRVFLLALGSTLLLAVAALEPHLVGAALLADAAILAAFLVDLRRARALPLRAARRWPALLVQGASDTVEVELTSERRVHLLARDTLHPGLSATSRRERLEVRPGERTLWRYDLVPLDRGRHRAGPLVARVLGPWGLAWSQRELLPPESCRVYPQVRWEGRVGRLLRLAHRRELGQSPLRVHGAGREPYALREYRPGDPPTRIHWKATARHGRLVSREDTWERGLRLVILLDCARTMASRDGVRSKLDHALAGALALTRVAAGRGDHVTLVAFSDRVEKMVRVRPGSRSVARAYEALYDLEPRLVEPAYDLAAEAAAGVAARRAVVVVLTSIVDLAAADGLKEALARLRTRRGLLVNLEDAEVTRLALGAPDLLDEAFAKASSLEIVLSNRRLARRLARSGIRAAPAAADQLAWNTLDAYLGL